MPSYEKNKSSGLWSVRFREDTEDGTKQKRLSGFKTKKDAQYGYEDYVTQRQKKLDEAAQSKIIEQSPNDMLFDDLVNAFLRFKMSRIKKTSYYETESRINNHILPFFTGIKIKDITPPKALEWQDSIVKYSYGYRKTLNSCLISIFRFGETYHNTTNIMKNIEKPRNLEPKKEMQIWAPDEFAIFCDNVENIAYKMLFRFLFISGCRRGEAAALNWDDFDLTARKVKICKNVSYKVRDNGKPYHITTPKNYGSYRNLPLPEFFCAELEEYKKWQSEHFDCTDFVFGSADPLPPSSIDRNLKRAAGNSGLKIIRVHDFRHSCASFLIHSGVSIVKVSKYLGHNNIEQTLNTYSHLLPDDELMLDNSLNSLSSTL